MAEENKRIKVSRIETLYLINDFLKTNYKYLHFVPRKMLYRIVLYFLLNRKNKKIEYNKTPKELWQTFKKNHNNKVEINGPRQEDIKN